MKKNVQQIISIFTLAFFVVVATLVRPVYLKKGDDDETVLHPWFLLVIGAYCAA